MTEEEAIKKFKSWLDYNKQYKNMLLNADEVIEVQETVLKLLQTKQEEIEKRDKQIFNLEKECQQNYDAMMDTISDNNNKNLMISLMAEQLTTPVHDKKWVIDYYKKKVEKC